jgi:hypothetical protein
MRTLAIQKTRAAFQGLGKGKRASLSPQKPERTEQRAHQNCGFVQLRGRRTAIAGRAFGSKPTVLVQFRPFDGSGPEAGL